MLIIKDIRSQQNLNTPKEKLRIKPSVKCRTIVDFSFGEWFVEKPLRKHNTVYKEIKLSIHQINIFSTITKSIEISYHEHPRSKTNQDCRLSAKPGLHTRKAARQQPLVQIPVPSGNGGVIQGEHQSQSVVRLRTGQGRQHHRIGAGTLFLRPCALPAQQDSGTSSTRPSRVFLFSPITIRTELPTIGGTGTHPSGIAALLAGARNRYRIGKTGVQGTTFHKQRQTLFRHRLSECRRRLRGAQPIFQGLHRSERHQPYSAAGRSEGEMSGVRGHDGLSFFPYVENEKLPDHAQP